MGWLPIPLLTIYDFTSQSSSIVLLLSNVTLQPPLSNHITTYATFMGCLINASSDAGFLCDHKIIENYFGTDDEIARFFINVRKDVAFDIEKSYLSKLFEDGNEYYRSDWHVRRADSSTLHPMVIHVSLSCPHTPNIHHDSDLLCYLCIYSSSKESKIKKFMYHLLE
ncbi:hypothetical protein CRYUN_Cryun02cG0173600 [Craigia yunnanensis]